MHSNPTSECRQSWLEVVDRVPAHASSPVQRPHVAVLEHHEGHETVTAGRIRTALCPVERLQSNNHTQFTFCLISTDCSRTTMNASQRISNGSVSLT